MGPVEVEALSLRAVIPAKEREEINKYGLSRKKFIELYHRYRFTSELINAVVSLRGKEQTERSYNAETACVGAKYCFSPEDIMNLGVDPAKLAVESEEFRRFGRLTLEKKVLCLLRDALCAGRSVPFDGAGAWLRCLMLSLSAWDRLGSSTPWRCFAPWSSAAMPS